MSAPEPVTFRTAPRTVHYVDHPLERLGGAVETFCGRRGVAYPPTQSSWRHCATCAIAKELSEWRERTT